jgi:hypothetical protein
MPLNRTQIDRVRTLTGHRMLQLSHLKGWDEQVVEDYLAMIDELAYSAAEAVVQRAGRSSGA